jgi:hypothetical protein
MDKNRQAVMRKNLIDKSLENCLRRDDVQIIDFYTFNATTSRAGELRPVLTGY